MVSIHEIYSQYSRITEIYCKITKISIHGNKITEIYSQYPRTYSKIYSQYPWTYYNYVKLYRQYPSQVSIRFTVLSVAHIGVVTQTHT